MKLYASVWDSTSYVTGRLRETERKKTEQIPEHMLSGEDV